ncbi:hypothetical protein PPYR_02774 [Photinus pyralis]|uniref:Uncharacterized protein n=3 Tax=Photinus pyralis TaxID=7054 RepID=A0A5N4A0X0_PHOPY|nr:uncharacterized protein LOC116161962 [Photinus pyralis]KAB0790974.1 hypothetical protein PPYR_02774 [Photinus pyralis]
MAKLVLVLLAAFANQVLTSTHTNYDLDNYLTEIKTEIRDLTVYLEDVFPGNHHAITTVTWQCHRVAEAIKNVVTKLSDETTKQHESGEIIFKQLWFALQEVHTSLQQIALSSDVTDVSEIKKQLILTLQLVTETFEKMMHVTYVHYPEFRATLKTIFGDYLAAIRDIRRAFETEHHDGAQRVSAKYLAMDITRFSQKVRYNLKEAAQGNFAWFYEGVGKIVRELETRDSVGDDEIDVVLRNLKMKLSKLEHDKDFGDVATLCVQLVHFVENGSQHERADRFIQKVIYDYLGLVRRLSEGLDSEQQHRHSFDRHM